MISRYGIFCQVIINKSFTRTAEQLGYSQSAISQTVKAMEEELGTRLVNRQKGQITLTVDGEKYMPYLRAIAAAEEALHEKQREMSGLKNADIRIGSIASVSQRLLPPLMQHFKERYPSVRFILMQEDYNTICEWARNGTIDFGFINTRAVSDGLSITPLYNDTMVAVLPSSHQLTTQSRVSLKDLALEPFILLDEGQYSLPLETFAAHDLQPHIEYKVYDETSILAMIRLNLGVSLMYARVLSDKIEGATIRPIEEKLERTVALAYRNWDTMPMAARQFAEFIIEQTPHYLS